MASLIPSSLSSLSSSLTPTFGAFHMASNDMALANILRNLIESLHISSHKEPPGLNEKQIADIKKIQTTAFGKRLSQSLQEIANGRWDEKTRQQLAGEIRDYLGQTTVRDGKEADEWNEIQNTLLKSLSDKQYWQSRETLATPCKRSIEQSSFIVSNPQTLLQNVSNFTLCGSVDNLAIFGQLGSQQMVEFFSFQNGILVGAPVSASINALLPSLAPSSDFVSACGYNVFHVITKNVGTIFHSIFNTTPGNQTMLTPPYAVNLFITDTANPAVTFPKKGLAVPALNTTASFYTTTNATNQINSLGSAIDTTTTVNPQPLGMQDGRVFVFHRPLNDSRLYVTVFNQLASVDATYILDLNQTTLGEILVEGIFGPKTPILPGTPVPFILTTNNHTSDFLITYLTSIQTITSSQPLPNSGIGPSGQRSLADCGNNQYAYARDIALPNSQFGIGYGNIQADLTNYTLTEGELILNFTLPSPGNPQVACLSNATVIIAYKNGSINYVTVNSFSGPSPAPLGSPLGSPPSPIEIDVSNVGDIPVKLDGQIVRISPDIVSVTLTSEGGFTVTYFVNGTNVDVPLGVAFSVGQVYNFSIVRRNATDSTPPTFLGCNSEGECSQSLPIKSTFQTTFDIGNNLILILSTVIPIPLVAIGITALIYRFWYLEHQKQLKAREQNTRRILAPKTSPSPEDQQEKWNEALKKRTNDEKKNLKVTSESP